MGKAAKQQRAAAAAAAAASSSADTAAAAAATTTTATTTQCVVAAAAAPLSDPGASQLRSPRDDEIPFITSPMTRVDSSGGEASGGGGAVDTTPVRATTCRAFGPMVSGCKVSGFKGPQPPAPIRSVDEYAASPVRSMDEYSA